MGAWGPGAFENDTALDFAAEIRTAQDLADALTIRTPDQPIDADTACRIVVVAECVAAMRGHPSDDMPRGLAERVATMPVDDRRFLELGCGAGLVSVAAAIAGFDVTATDYYDEALRFTALNVLVNTGVLIDTRIGDWRRFPHDIGRFQLVVASDVLYEQPHAALIAGVLDRTLTGRGSAMIADPGRVAAPRFVEECKERGMPAAILDRVPFEEGNIRQTIDLYEVRRR